MGYSLGIDVGTSTTKISVKQDDKPPVALPISITGDKLLMPSVVAYRKTFKNTAEVYAVGEDAERAPNTEAFAIIRDIKRFLEVTENPPRVFPYQDYPWWNSEKKCVQLWQTSLKVEDVIRVITKEALSRAIRRARELGLIAQTRRSKWQYLLSIIKKIFGKQEKNNDILTIQGWPVRLGCSVTAGLEARKMLRSVAQNLGFAGFKFEHLREEPILASLPYLQRELHPGETVLVYDFGGGSFDSAVIRIEQNSPDGLPSMTVLSTEGSAFCGGVDIDRNFTKYIARRIAQEYFGDDRENKYREIMEQRHSQLVNIARETKELLSDQSQRAVLMPPDFLNRPGIVLNVTQQELEEVITESGVLEETEICILSAWRKARMIWRQQNEVCDDFNVEMDTETGKILKTIFQLNFDDLSKMVNRILLIGGTTKIPLVQRRLHSHLKNVQFISEKDPYEPIVACALGAASQKEHVNSIIDRLPFSVVVKKGDNEIEMYRAYTPTISYNTITDKPKIKDFISNNVCSVSKSSDCLNIECITPDGEVIAQTDNLTMSPGRYVLNINNYGMIHFGHLEVNNPKQHQLQIDMWSRIQKEKERLKQEDLDRTKKYLSKLPGEDHNLEVG